MGSVVDVPRFTFVIITKPGEKDPEKGEVAFVITEDGIESSIDSYAGKKRLLVSAGYVLMRSEKRRQVYSGSGQSPAGFCNLNFEVAMATELWVEVWEKPAPRPRSKKV